MFLQRDTPWSMKRSDTYEFSVMRIYALLACMILAVCCLVVYLAYLQIWCRTKYADQEGDQSLRRVWTPGRRGSIYDKNGVCLAGNRASYCIAIALDRIKQTGQPGKRALTNRIHQIIGDLQVTLNTNMAVSNADIENHLRRRSPLPLVIMRDADETSHALFAENKTRFPEVELIEDPVRYYPEGKAAAHVLGYVGRGSPEKESIQENTFEGPREKPDYYMNEIEGRQGIEKAWDKVLKGDPGGHVIRVDVAGIRRDLTNDTALLEKYRDEPIPGTDLKLSIDARIQRLAAQAVDGTNGAAAVVLDPRTGDILAMASFPAFDPNKFAAGISRADWKDIVSDPDKPILNRAAAGSYAPGSLFKIVVAAAALEKGIPPSTTFNCPGYFSLGGGWTLKCWKTTGHGNGLDMETGIEQSCNVYFCSLGQKCGYYSIREMATKLGLGRKVGLDMDVEGEGRLPAVRSVRRLGDIANASVGQGAIEATPLQMAVLAGAVGTGGHVCRPRLVTGQRPPGEEEFIEIPPQPLADLGWSETTITTLKRGMRRVIHADAGTGRIAKFSNDVFMGGKTGTAEFSLGNNKKKKWGWMMVFAPYDNPRYAAAIVVEDAIGGGKTAGPRMKLLMAGIFGEKDVTQ